MTWSHIEGQVRLKEKKKFFSAFMDAVIFYLEIAGTTIRFTM